MIAVFVALFIVGAIAGDPESTDADEAPGPDATSVSSRIAMPDLVGESLADAKQTALDAGFTLVDSHDASEGSSGQWSDSNWTVCFQTPAAGTKAADPATTEVDLAVVRTAQPCPKADGEPIPYPRMPDVIEASYGKASERIEKLGVYDISASSAFTDVDVPDAPASWTVCFQKPRAGARITDADSTSVGLALVRPGDRCPSDRHTARNPKPDPTPASTPTPTPTPTPAPAEPTTEAPPAGECEIVSNAGNCYQAGQFCRSADEGRTTHDAAGRLLKCTYSASALRWVYV